MYMYQIESYRSKRNKNIIIIICIVAVILIGIAIFAGIKVAQNNNEQRQLAELERRQVEEQLKQRQEEERKQKEEQERLVLERKKANTKLTQEQIERVENIYNSEEKRAFLTFDDGPSNSVTPLILDTLKKENIKATFFVLGTMVKNNPELVLREKQEGHYIANHGYSHVYKTIYANENKPLEEYNKTNELIQKALNDAEYQSNVFRYPGGSYGGYYEKIKTKSKTILKENNIAYLDWNALTNDADGADTEEKIMKNLQSTCKGKKSVVILMHDAPNKSLTAETLPKVIEYLREQGYSFKSLYDVL